jgi:DNA (cytosine-5)-methyltransferase 1
MRGLERGIERAIGRVTVATYVEIEAFIIYNLVRQMEQGVVDAAPVWTDLKTFPAQQFYGKIDGIIGGYPCQPFSVAGLQKGTDDPRHLWPHIKIHIETIRPAWCFFENVANHLNIGYRQVRSDLESLGYAVKEGIYTAEEAGAPHERKRLFILALANANSDGRQTDGNAKAAGENDKGRRQECSTEQRPLRTGTKAGRLPEDQAGTAENVADAGSKGLEGQRIFSGGSGQAFAKPAQHGSHAWPAGQGKYQHEGEEPRTVKPGLGCTVNGYNFRTDLLRMYGNGVVEQTAEIAFLDLLRRHESIHD